MLVLRSMSALAAIDTLDAIKADPVIHIRYDFSLNKSSGKFAKL
jgi:hypothetical protein